ncbi:apolipoprotein N-acyltransferase [Allofrancisella inopinata]|uniref:Apolipoprotein N-acyltransferase n=1 Tax=Allofrancisella inopinata TaxID=1085647 RepID=A0AAE7CQU4_9GAMM|nr:apolipoprotein N-acyltransferase [Allofrancisella inopinata]QIV96152.1 apolipoprotein N-acyltransferase [Allofrancisella inopinata]TDT72068.1 apolipoprotein N-acyltransferase [Allofrancisella inopinata]
MKKNILNLILATLSGSLLTLAFAPFRIDIIAIVALCIFFYLLNKCSKLTSSFLISAFFGFGFFGTSISWVYISIHLFTNSVAAGIVAAIALVILLSFLHTIPFGIGSYLLTKKSNNFIKLLIYPALWTLFEVVKANLLWGGFPWVSLGYSQTESPLIWYANVGGVYFVTYIIALISALIVLYLFNKTKDIRKTSLIFSAIALIYIGGYIISKSQPNIQTNKVQKVVLVQGDFIQGFKWNQDNFIKMQAYYKSIASKYQNSLIILSENALPDYRQYQHLYFEELTKIANQNNNAILIGSLSIENSKIYNSSTILGKGKGIYNKHHLVPFGEYFPIKFFGYIDSVGLSNFNAGTRIQPIMQAFDYPLANFICYEIGYPEQVRDQLQGARLISVISDDSWFGDSIARDQQLQISQVRAIETSKYVLATTSNGITAIIDPSGVIVKELPKDTQATLESEIYLNDFETIWLKIGMSLIFLVIGISIVFVTIFKIIKERFY